MMFTKRFVTMLLVALLSLVLGTSALAQNDTRGIGSDENPVTEWLESLSDHLQIDQNKSTAWQLFETFGDFLRGASQTETLDRLSLINGFKASDIPEFSTWGNVIDKWAHVLQDHASSQTPAFVNWLQQFAERLDKMFHKSQQLNPLVSALSSVSLKTLIGLETAQ